MCIIGESAVSFSLTTAWVSSQTLYQMQLVNKTKLQYTYQRCNAWETKKKKKKKKKKNS